MRNFKDEMFLQLRRNPVSGFGMTKCSHDHGRFEDEIRLRAIA